MILISPTPHEPNGTVVVTAVVGALVLELLSALLELDASLLLELGS
jgi:hypothetical protein